MPFSNKYVTQKSKQLISKHSLQTDLKKITPETDNPRKRALQFSSYHASMTVEACVALPLFLFTVFFVLFFLEVIRIQMEVGSEIQQIAKEVGVYGYLYGKAEDADIKSDDLGTDIMTNIFSDIYVDSRLKSAFADEKNQVSHIENGEEGIGLFLSTYMKDNIIDIVVNYDIKIPFSYFIKKNIPVIQRARVRAWTGYSGEHKNMEGERMVYITLNGSVYHLNSNCPYLVPSVQAVFASEISSLRNASGEKYYPCEICGSNKVQNKTVYITDYGNRYHTSLECSGLKRNVLVVPISEAGNRKACSKCGGD